MKALFVPYHFWLKNYFPAQQIQPLEGDNNTWLLICLQNGDFVASGWFTPIFFLAQKLGMVKIHDFGLMMLPGDSSATGDNSQKPKSKQRAWRPLVDLYGKTFLAKVAHIFIVYHPLKERKSVSVTKHKIWGIEICPKMSLSRPDFTFWALSQDRDAPGQIYLTTSDHHGCRNLGQQEKFFALGTSYSRLRKPVS